MEHDKQGAERRAAVRVDLERPVAVRVGAAACAGLLVNLSCSGMLIAVEGELTIWATVRVALSGEAWREARVVRRHEGRYGLLFRDPLSPEQFAALTGVEPAEPEPPVECASGPAVRVGPRDFGRDRVKSFLRRSRELATTGRR